MASGMIPLEATAARQRVGSFRSRLKKQQPIMMSEPPTWGGATASPETLLRPLPTSVSSVDFPCNVAVTVHEFIDSNQEICDLWYDTIYWYKIYYLTFTSMRNREISFRNCRDKPGANSGSFQLNQTILVIQNDVREKRWFISCDEVFSWGCVSKYIGEPSMTRWWCHRRKHTGSTHECFLEK